MAFGVKSWLAGVALSCGVISLTLISSKTYDPTGGWRSVQTPVDRHAWELFDRAAEARWKLRPSLEYLKLLERRDSAVMALHDTPSEEFDEPTLLFDAGLPAKGREATESILRRQWDVVARHGGRAAAAVSVQLDTNDRTLDVPRRLGLGLYLGYSVPSNEHEVCFAIVTVGSRTAQRMDTWVRQHDPDETTLIGYLPTTAPELLGPCAYFGAFGMPGSSIRAWLESVIYGPAILPTWVSDPPSADPSKEYRERLRWPTEYRTVDLYPCAAGDRARCRSAVLTPVSDHYSFRFPIEFATRRPTGLVNASRFRWAANHPLGLGVRSYLADLLTEMGRGRFEAFWQSDGAVDAAFSAAFGIPIEDWTMKWARDQIGEPPRGPATRPLPLLQAIILAAVFLGGGIGYVSKRQVG